MNPIERIIEIFSPTWAAKREVARLTLSASRRYDGASNSRRTAGWTAPSTSANAEAEAAAINLRNRMRDLVRNNPWASKAINVIVSNTVGTGIMAAAKSGNKRGSEAAMKAWRAWSETTECDALRKSNFYGLQALALRTVAESGEALIIRETVTSNTTIPYAIRICEPDHLDKSKDGKENNNTIRQGIEFDNRGVAVAYWIFPEHPGERANFGYKALTSVRISADRVQHLFRQDRPGQTRGVPWGASVVLRLRDLDDYEDAQLLRQKISACYTAFVVDVDGSVGTGGSSEITEKIEPGAIEILPPGRDIRFANPPALSGYNEYTSSVLHGVAAGFGITYEALTGDMSQVNFSSGRMGWLEFNRNVESWRWNILIPQMLNPIWDWFIEGAGLVGQSFPGVKAEWTPPRREMIDPKSEIAATKDSIRSGLMTLSEAQRMFGYDPSKLMAEYAEDLKTLDSFGIILDTDARNTNANGATQAAKPDANADEPTNQALRLLVQKLTYE